MPTADPAQSIWVGTAGGVTLCRSKTKNGYANGQPTDNPCTAADN